MSTEHKFGGEWTEKKLDAVEKYLGFFTSALKNQNFKLCYIDAFSGSGNVTLKNGVMTDGSAIRALKYPFDKYFFIENDKIFYDALSKKIEGEYPDKSNAVSVLEGDCNKLLQSIDSRQWRAEGWRGVIFLDPYAMDLDWDSLEKISKTQVFDVWYLFPFSAANRNLYNNGRIPQANEEKLNRIFGTTDWKEQLYTNSPQLTLFGDLEKEKIPDGLRQFIIKRLRETFSNVADNPAVLKNKTNSPLFLLCFAVSNPNPSAWGLALKGANHILKSTED
ncbi:MAG: three-Cys-motif partner protein TcmP [Oscillospiraceae bacterium]|nr:three-Cys-motif partner protein TcmP [Oscillospiraceae bacterium]